MSVLVLDIETLGTWTQEQAVAVQEMAEAREMEPDAFVALCPPMARVVCVGILDLDGGREIALYDSDAVRSTWQSEDGTILCCEDEPALLVRVNDILGKASRLVTFNGRGFDLPCLIHRTIGHGLKPSPRLVAAAREYRYKPSLHIDVRDQFTFFGAAPAGTMRAFALGYGLDDPKAGGSGAGVGALVAAHDAEKLSRYCLGDVRTTAVLYQRWLGAVGAVA